MMRSLVGSRERISYLSLLEEARVTFTDAPFTFPDAPFTFPDAPASKESVNEFMVCGI